MRDISTTPQEAAMSQAKFDSRDRALMIAQALCFATPGATADAEEQQGAAGPLHWRSATAP